MGLPLLDSTTPRVQVQPASEGFAALVGDMDAAVLADLGGEPVIYQPAAGQPVSTTPDGRPLTGLFDEQYQLAQGDPLEAGVTTLVPAVFLRLADLPTDPEIDEPTIMIRGVVYRAQAPHTAGMGSIWLPLRRMG